MTEIINHPCAFWCLIAVIAGICEMSLPYFAFSFASVSAGVTALLALGVSWPIQIASFSVVMILSLVFVRPWLLRKLHGPHQMPSRSQALVGLQGQVIEAIDPMTKMGRVLVQGQDWAARSEQAVGQGELILVDGHDGIVLLVRKV